MSLDDWLAKAPTVASSRESLVRTYKRSMVDLAALRYYPAIAPGHSLPAAGLPWFMALFGRDSIITSLQALPFEPELAVHNAARPRRSPGHPHVTTSATRSRERSCTSRAWEK